MGDRIEACQVCEGGAIKGGCYLVIKIPKNSLPPFATFISSGK